MVVCFVKILFLLFPLIFRTTAAPFLTKSLDVSSTKLHNVLDSIWKSPEMRSWHQMTKEGRMEALHTALYNNLTLRKLAKEEHDILWSLKPSDASPPNFNCTITHSECKPTSVHKLTPGDINVVGAVGDSISAGTGILASTLPGVLVQYRGHVFSMGGVENAKTNPTLPNILREYNRHLTGFSTGKGDVNTANAVLNLAVPGANSMQLMEQTRRLIDRMKNNPSVDFNNDWKLITIFMGNNDICDFCDEAPDVLTPANYKLRIQAALDLLHQEVPRAFVNLVSIMDVSEVPNLNIGLVCTAVHYFVCRCAAFPKNSSAVIEMNNQFQDELLSLVDSGRYDTREDFTVVIQPYMHDTVLPRLPTNKIDLSYFAPDCFHLSAKGHWQAALSLWNSMLEPVGSKRRSWVPGEPYECPTVENPYFATAKNSKSKSHSSIKTASNQYNNNNNLSKFNYMFT